METHKETIKTIKDIFGELEELLAYKSGFCKQIHKTFYSKDEDIDESWKDMIKADKLIKKINDFTFDKEWKTSEEIINNSLHLIIKCLKLNNHLYYKWDM